MKQIEKITLNSSKTRLVLNQKNIYESNSNSAFPQGKPICDCAGCIWEDGGTGFALGMNLIK